MNHFKDYFSNHASEYARSRPGYPPELSRYLAEHSPAGQLAWDCGCGSGQFAVLLPEYFDKVIATDASQAQIDNATPHPKVEYLCTPAENSGLPSGSVDLIVAAQAAHWFYLPAFYEEAHRVAKKKALIALFCYGLMHVDSKVDSLVRYFYHEVLDDYWPSERRLLEGKYRNIPFPFEEVVFPELEIVREWTLPELLDYIKTWSAVKLLINAGKSDALTEFEKNMEVTWGSQSAKNVRWPLSGRIGIIRH